MKPEIEIKKGLTLAIVEKILEILAVDIVKKMIDNNNKWNNERKRWWKIKQKLIRNVIQEKIQQALNNEKN